MISDGDTSFDITRRQRAVIVSVHGTLDLAGSTRIGALLSDLIEAQGNLRVAVDLRGVIGVDPAGLGVLSVAASVARRRGGELEVMDWAGEAADRTGHLNAPAHLVEFYDTDARLVASVCDFLEPALRSAQPAVVVASARHRDLFDAALVEAGVDVGEARALGHFVAVDAEATLSQFMVADVADRARFDATMSGLLARAGAHGGTARVYGEMVAVLWARGNVASALAVEDLWNGLGRRHRFALLCAYPSASFDADAPAGSLRAVCEGHSAASNVQPVSSSLRMLR